VAAPQLGRAQLEEKDREDLAQIASALGLRGVAKADKSTLIEKILEETMAPEPKDKESTPRASAPKVSSREKASAPLGADGEPLSEWEIELAEHEGTPIAPDARVEGESRRERNDSRGDRGDRAAIRVATAAIRVATVRIATATSATPAATSTTVADVTAADADVAVAAVATKARRVTTGSRSTKWSRTSPSATNP